MSKNFEEEYRDYLNAQAPDLWDRIEAGIDAADAAADFGASDNVISIREGKQRKENKNRKQKYRRYKLITAIAACLFALVMIIPVYMLVSPKGSNESADTAPPMILADVTIENSTANADTAVTEDNAQDSTPAESLLQETYTEEQTETQKETEIQEGAADIVVNLEEESAVENAQEELDAMPAEAGGCGDDNMQLASAGIQETEELIFEETSEGEMLVNQEELSVPAEETMELLIQSDGENRENGMIYTAADPEDTSRVVKLLVTAESGIVLENGKSYTVTATCASDAEYYTVIRATIE